ncbi:hypothetical protein J2W31_001699 [Variovorax boronicumulans]|uniref:Uncharacterized protein n=1 Tax=Variovorax boronicumulans TaxID=436515 RepID=A0AAW8CXF5_9BURK|nr:hypothetical protein [Variovorax boronicumulans]
MAGPGLLDFLVNDPSAQLGIGLLAAGGPSTTPMNVGQRMQMAMQGVAAQQDAEMRRKLLQSQMEENASQNALRQSQITKAGQIQAMTNGMFAPSPASSGMGADPASAGGGFAIGINPGVPTQAPVGQAGAASGLRGIPLENIARLKAAGGPDLLDAWKLANVPTQLSAGGYTQLPGQAPQYLPDPTKGVDYRNGAVSLLPGSEALATLSGQQAGAQAAAKTPYDIQADRARQITQAQLDPVRAINQTTGNTDYVPRISLAGGQAAGMNSGGVALGGNIVPGTGGAAGAQAQGQNPYIAERNPIRQQSATALNDNWIKTSFNPVREAGGAATNLLNNVQALRNIDFQSGWGSEAKANAAAMLQGLGMGTANSDLYAANAQKFQSVAMDRLMTKQIEQKGTATEGDAKRLNQTFVSLKNTPEANAFLLDFAEAQANQDRRKAEYYEQAMPLAQNEGDLTKVDRMWRKVQGSIWNDPLLQKWSK